MTTEYYLKGVLIELYACNFMHVKTSLRVCCMHAHYSGRNLSSSDNGIKWHGCYCCYSFEHNFFLYHNLSILGLKIVFQSIHFSTLFSCSDILSSKILEKSLHSFGPHLRQSTPFCSQVFPLLLFLLSYGALLFCNFFRTILDMQSQN